TTSITAPVLPVDVDVTSLEQSLGLPLDEFSKVAETLGVEVRVTERDGESLPVTMDYRSDRVNVSVVTTDGVEVVKSITSLG
ncbi:MAG TPA: hypothetical protein VMM60_03365, partial [Ilumatobacter sp.]|nr:hypothetical protein [Ilumatobacter sp.]